MKAKLLPILLVILILLNGVLIFMLIKKPHENRGNNKERTFLVEQLAFTQEQKEDFFRLDEAHRKKMIAFEEETRKHKDLLFNSFSDDSIDINAISKLIAELDAQKDIEVFKFFKTVRKICTPEQQEKFDKIIKKAIRGGGNSPQESRRKHPPIDGNMPPPPR